MSMRIRDRIGRPGDHYPGCKDSKKVTVTSLLHDREKMVLAEKERIGAIMATIRRRDMEVARSITYAWARGPAECLSDDTLRSIIVECQDILAKR